MTIQKVRPNGWPNNSTLTSAEVTQLDKNASYGIDKASGNTDNIYSTLTVEEGSVTFASGSDLIIDAPEKVTVSAGTLKVGAEINGSPLKIGIAFIDCSSSSSITLSQTEYEKGVLVLTGTLSSDVSIVFPVSSFGAYSKIIDNQCINEAGVDYKVTLKTSSSTATTVQIDNSQAGMIFVQGSNISLACNTRKNDVIADTNLFSITNK